jgi:hypothetical protein
MFNTDYMSVDQLLPVLKLGYRLAELVRPGISSVLYEVWKITAPKNNKPIFQYTVLWYREESLSGCGDGDV